MSLREPPSAIKRGKKEEIADKPEGCSESVYFVKNREGRAGYYVGHDAGYGYSSHAVQDSDFKGFYNSFKVAVTKEQPLRFHTFLEDDKCTLVFDINFQECPTYRLDGDDVSCLASNTA